MLVTRFWYVFSLNVSPNEYEFVLRTSWWSSAWWLPGVIASLESPLNSLMDFPRIFALKIPGRSGKV